MSFRDYSTDPNANGAIAGIDVSEDCPPGGINDAIRQLMADGKELSQEVGGTSSGMPVSGGAFTGDITRSGRGAYLHHASPSLTDGRVITAPVGTARPTPAEGLLVLYYK